MHMAVDCTYQSVMNAPGGGATFLREMVPHLKKNLDRFGDKLTVFCPREDREFYNNLGMAVHAVATRPNVRRALSSHFLVPRASAQLGVDIMLLPGNWASLVKTAKQVVIAQSLLTFKHFSGELGLLKSTYRRAATRMTTERADLMIFLSRHQQEEFARAYPLGPCRVVYPGAPPRSDRMPNEKKWILVVSALWDYKNLDGVIDIADTMRGRGISLPIFIVGDGPSRDRLRKRIQGEGHDMVRLLGQMPVTEVYQLYQHAAMTLNLSKAESFGFPVLESMTFGIPTLISDLGSFREVAGDAGIVVRTALEAVDWIDRLLVDPEAWERMSRISTDRASAFRWERTVSEIATLCRRLVDGRGLGDSSDLLEG